MAKCDDFWVILPGRRIKKRKGQEKHWRLVCRVFVMETITVGIQETGILSLERAQDFL
jgi:hypothetical protein